MKAIILASGVGRRLLPLTRDKPKCLVKINNQTILGRLLKQITDFKINAVIITTGAFEDKVKEFVNNNFPNLNVYYVRNPKFDKTNYIYSLWLAKEFIDDDILLIHGDIVVDHTLIKRLIESEYRTCVLVSSKSKRNVIKKDFKCKIEGGSIKKIGIDISESNIFHLMPVYKISREDFTKWLAEIEKFIISGKLNFYIEDAFNNISNKINLKPIYYKDELCMEIDDIIDLAIVRGELSKTNFGE